MSDEAAWSANFRDLNNAIVRMATLAPGGRITREIVADELARLRLKWDRNLRDLQTESGPLEQLLSVEHIARLDLFDRIQLAEVLKVCASARSMSEAGRILFSISRTSRKKVNDADRLKKYLARFGLDWRSIHLNP
jgi:transcriptional regulatory protein RtcR